MQRGEGELILGESARLESMNSSNTNTVISEGET